ncbi:MAG: RNA-binding cell elongation regulator Jag/EloR [Bacilli bacterium]|nr:RNA-binding cell elongation regulator Jag/EloR [Bacilli bacterium]
MKKYIYEAKNYEEAQSKALAELNLDEQNVIINTLEEKQGLLKKSIKIEVISINDILSDLKDKISTILNLMNIDANLEIKRKEENITINIFSNHNSILIGKEGKTLDSLQNIMRQILLKETSSDLKLIIDVENYKEHRITNIERTARKVAREVAKTKVEASLEPMNSYERRIVHNTLSKNKYVYTKSIGEEPNRYVMIKLKEEI